MSHGKNVTTFTKTYGLKFYAYGLKPGHHAEPAPPRHRARHLQLLHRRELMPGNGKFESCNFCRCLYRWPNNLSDKQMKQNTFAWLAGLIAGGLFAVSTQAQTPRRKETRGQTGRLRRALAAAGPERFAGLKVKPDSRAKSQGQGYFRRAGKENRRGEHRHARKERGGTPEPCSRKSARKPGQNERGVNAGTVGKIHQAGPPPTAAGRPHQRRSREVGDRPPRAGEKREGGLDSWIYGWVDWWMGRAGAPPTPRP